MQSQAISPQTRPSIQARRHCITSRSLESSSVSSQHQDQQIPLPQCHYNMNPSLQQPHQQFAKKFLQLSQISQKIDSFIQTYKTKNNEYIPQVHNSNQHKNLLREKLVQLRKELLETKEQFSVVRNDLFVCSQLPKEFIRMVVQLPAVYEGFWESRENSLYREIAVLVQQNDDLKDRLREKDQLIHDLYNRFEQQQKIYNHPPAPELVFQPNLKLDSKTHEHIHNPSKHPIHPIHLQPHKKPVSHSQLPQLPQQLQNSMPLSFALPFQLSTLQDAEEDLDSYINNMQITIRESNDLFCKKITEHGSQEEEESQDLMRQGEVARILTTREDMLTEERDQRNKKNTESSLLFDGRRKPKKIQVPNNQDQNSNRNTFWNKLSKTLNKKSKSKSLTKQNINTKPVQIRQVVQAQKKILTSKITDLRRQLFVEKGLQRLGIKVENIM